MLGVAATLFFMGIAAAFTGAVLYSYFQYQLDKTNEEVDRFTSGFGDRVDDALGTIASQRDSALGEIDAQLKDLERFAATSETLTGLVQASAPSVWFVSTLDEAGQPSVGSAFVLFSDADQSFLVTSFTTVRAATASPSPAVTIRKDAREIPARVTAWDPGNDLALLTVDEAKLPALGWAPTDPPPQIGDRVFVLSGSGAAGAAITQGAIADVSGSGLQHDAPVGAAFQGGPVLDADGKVLGVASRTFAPQGFAPEAVFIAVPIRNVCTTIVQCPEGAQQPPSG